MVDKEIRVGIFAEEDISAGEEITFDYQFERFGGKKQKCFCGETNCRGFLGAKPKKVLHPRRKERATRAIIGRPPRGNVVNPLTVEAILEYALHFNPINKVRPEVLFRESDLPTSPSLGVGSPLSPPPPVSSPPMSASWVTNMLPIAPQAVNTHSTRSQF